MSRDPDWDRLQWVSNPVSDSHLVHTLTEYRNVQEAQIAVPAMWSPEARGVMSRAAGRALFDNINLREEPQCVAGACMSDLRDDGQIDVRHLVNLCIDIYLQTDEDIRRMTRCCFWTSARELLYASSLYTT